MAIIYLSKVFFIKKNRIASTCTFLCLNHLLFRNMKPNMNSLVNSVDPDQLASEEAS